MVSSVGRSMIIKGKVRIKMLQKLSINFAGIKINLFGGTIMSNVVPCHAEKALHIICG